MHLTFFGQKVPFEGGSVVAGVKVRPGKEFCFCNHLPSVLAGGQILNLSEL